MFSTRLYSIRKLKLFLLSTLVVTLFLTCLLSRLYAGETKPTYFVSSENNANTKLKYAIIPWGETSISHITPVKRNYYITGTVKINKSYHGYNNLRYEYRRYSKKYLFALHYYEQLGRATGNLIHLASLGKFGNRKVSLPFVNSSRLSGVPYKGNNIDHISSKQVSKSFAPLSVYYDLSHFNDSLFERGYSTFINFHEFTTACQNKIEVMVHFLYPEQNTFYSTLRWFNVDKDSLERIVVRMKESGGWTDCSFLDKNYLVRELSGITIQQLFCIDPNIIVSPEVLELVIFGKKACVGVLFWKGSGENERTKFSTHPSITNRLHISELRHSKIIVNMAEDFVKNTFLKSEFLSVHIRAEKLFLDFGLNKTLTCMEDAALLINEVRETYALSNIFLSTDFSEYGSDTFVALTKFSDFNYLKKYFLDMLDKTPTTFLSNQTLDKGVVSLIEMNILAKGSFLVTIGRGHFHSWVVEYFLKGKQIAQVQRVCHEQP